MQLSHFHLNFFFLNCSFLRTITQDKNGHLPYFTLPPYVAKTVMEDFVSYRILFLGGDIVALHFPGLHVGNLIDTSISHILRLLA